MDLHTLFVVTGAPGAGKTTTAQALLDSSLAPGYVYLDIDWLANSSSQLAGKSIYTEPSTWQPYGELWFDVLLALVRNGKQPVFFTPNSPADFDQPGLPAWCKKVY